MAKKKRRYKHKAKKHTRTVSHYNKHHILWQRAKWNRGALKELRDYWYCTILVPKDTLHKHIHSCVSQIPTPNEWVAKVVLEQLRYFDLIGVIDESDSLADRLKILILLFDHTAPETTYALKKQYFAVHEY